MSRVIKSKMLLIKRRTLITLNIFYWMPDYENILQQLIWQTMDVKPKYPRVHKFLDYWHNSIDAKLSEVIIYDSERSI